MNKETRKQCSDLVSDIQSIKERVEELQSTEQEKLDNLPEGLQASGQGEAIQTAVNTFDSANDWLDEAISTLEDIAE